MSERHRAEPLISLGKNKNETSFQNLLFSAECLRSMHLFNVNKTRISYIISIISNHIHIIYSFVF